MHDSEFSRSEEMVILALFVAPALLGILALYMGISILRDQAKTAEENDLRKGIAILSLIAALGIGACYGAMGLGWLRF